MVDLEKGNSKLKTSEHIMSIGNTDQKSTAIFPFINQKVQKNGQLDWNFFSHYLHRIICK